ncbi:hypothetical protein BDN70DRAFT_800099 [Pholiota conissans]|uniref:Uncharacterized protein n=1 Tax=Pholiota conissans TaxID=109636 RepID=A0A9P5Z8Y8_9AGAR|nr:hypothetical protein BDN70DRAFT_800099 [Pholiota conissans]
MIFSHNICFDLPNTLSPLIEAAPELVHNLQPLKKPNDDAFRSKAKVLCLIAKAVVDILHVTGVECALFGSLACYLYGNTRSPNDIDLVASSCLHERMDAERLKRVVVDRDPEHFCLGAPKDPSATYRILYFVVDQVLAPANTFHKNRCKIDILVPGLLHLPSLTGKNVRWRGELPVVPFSVLLLQKLQGWDDHLHMKEPYKFIKHKTDAEDIRALLALEHVVSLRFAQPWEDRALFSPEFMALSRWRIADFCREYPETEPEWRRIGFKN